MEREMKKVASIAILWAAFAVPALACDKPAAPSALDSLLCIAAALPS